MIKIIYRSLHVLIVGSVRVKRFKPKHISRYNIIKKKKEKTA